MNCIVTLLCLTGLVLPGDAPVGSPASSNAVPTAARADADQEPEPASAEREALVTDRPDATESADTVARGLFQLETGYTFSRSDDAEDHTLGELLLRIGVADDVEVRIGLDSYVWRPSGPDGLTDTSIGLKWRLAEGGGPGSGRPTVALLASTSLPTGADALGDGAAQPELVLAAGLDLTETIGLGANVGWSYRNDADADERFSEMIASLAVGFGLGERWGAYFEYFGAWGLDGRPDEDFLNGGLTWLLHDDLQLDGRVGYGLNGRDDDVFAGVGAAVRW